MPRPRSLLLVLLAALVSLGTAGCSRKHEAYKRAKTEGLEITANHVKYQIQLSRALNPKIPSDRSLLRDVPSDVPQPNAGQEWFGVWMRVENDGDKKRFSASRFEIEDSLGKRYEPIPLDPKKNPLVYAPTALAPRSVLPDPDSPAGEGGPRGLLILFKLDLTAYQNRPLEFRVIPAIGADATVELDL